MDIKALCKLARSNEDNSATPIMVITSNTSIEHEKELLKLGIEYFVRKPVEPDILFYAIKNIVYLLAVNRGISPLTKLPRKYPYSSRTKKETTKEARVCSTILRFRQL